MNRRERLRAWLFRQSRRFTWPWMVSRTGLAGLIYMLFEPSSATPALVVAFAAMVGLKPMADLDKFINRHPVPPDDDDEKPKSKEKRNA